MNNSRIELFVTNEKGLKGSPKVLEGVMLQSERFGTPSKLDFEIIKDNNYFISEGDKISLYYDDTPIFLGFVFKIARTKDEVVKITAYDQLRYLKNKDIIEYENIRADEVVKMVTEDFKIELGELDNTKFIIGRRKEDNKTLLDIINTALAITTQNTKKLYVLYDDFGKLTLKDIETLKINYIIDKNNIEDYIYNSSIDDKTYNRIKITKEDEKKGLRELYISQDSDSHKKWGILQLLEGLNEGENPIQKANILLELYNQPTKSLSIRNAVGDIRCRGGFSLIVNLNLGDVVLKNIMIINRVVHTFKYQEHLMSLDLVGGGAINV